MIAYRNIVNLEEARLLWNKEMGNIYPITSLVYNQNVINYQEKFVYGAYLDNNLLGFIIAKKYEKDDLDSYNNLGFISLIYVSKKQRKQGIGTRLLQEAHEYLKDKKTINVGKDINNFFPGIPCDFDNLTDIWFEKRCYV